MANDSYGDVSVTLDGHVALVEIHRPPHNYFDQHLLKDLAEAFQALDNNPECRALVLASEGKSFCAGTDFGKAVDQEPGEWRSRVKQIYSEAANLFTCKKPVVAAIQGAAVGGGLGLALLADFRVASKEAWFSANFVKLGIHPGFGLTYTLPRVIGVQRSALMFYTGRRIAAEQAVEWGLADILSPADQMRETAKQLAVEIATGAPLAVLSTRATMRQGLADAARSHMVHELAEQTSLRRTEDHQEGVRSVRERRPGRFTGR